MTAPAAPPPREPRASRPPTGPHRRWNPLTREWVLVSPQRTARPWLGQTEEPPVESRPAYDPSCTLCPGNARAGGTLNPRYDGTFVFDNDYPALLAKTPEPGFDDDGLLVAEAEPGVCRVVCFSPRHDLSLSRMAEDELRSVVDAWVEQVRELGARASIGYVQIFENSGAMMGASNPHPHGQIWASATIPNQPAREQASLLERRAAGSGCLLCRYLAIEEAQTERVVCGNQHFAVVVPFWAVWPFETLVVAKRHRTGLDQLDEDERRGLADILGRLTRRYDDLFGVPFPYSMGLHQRPTDGGEHPEWHMHVHFYPPLLRSSTVRKFMVGYEMLATPQRDTPPEASAERLRQASEIRPDPSRPTR